MCRISRDAERCRMEHRQLSGVTKDEVKAYCQHAEQKGEHQDRQCEITLDE